MNLSTIVFASFIAGLFCSLAFVLSINEEQRELVDQEDSEGLDESYTGLQKTLLNLVAASLSIFSVAGVFMIAEIVWRFK